jgi:hypothetical protein
MNDADINFYLDPLCPFAWMTGKLVLQVAAQRDYTVNWRFISLRMINAGVDCDSHFTAGYEADHTARLRLLRVVARTRAERRRQAVGPLYEAIGTEAFDFAAAPALDQKNWEPASSSSPCWGRSACPRGSPAPSMTPAGTANCGRKPTRRSR